MVLKRSRIYAADQDPLLRSNVATHFLNKWVDIVLSVVSIVQGFAFANLAQRLPQLIEAVEASGDFTTLAYWLLAFALLLRVFQTYVVAALDYEEWDVSFSDVFLIFVIGTIEYYIFSTLDARPFSGIAFHKRFLLLSIVGLVGYSAALSKLRPHHFPLVSLFRNEILLQRANIATSVAAGTISIVVVAAARSELILGSALVCAVITAWSIWFSLQRTIRLRIQITGLAGISAVMAQVDEPIPWTIRSAVQKDVEEIARMLATEFRYVYEPLFETSLELTTELLRRLLEANGGDHNLGVKSFFVAVSPNNQQVVGMMLLSPPRKYGLREARAVGRFCITLLRYLGLPRVFRVIRNLGLMSTIVPISGPGEINISYIAVSPELRRKTVASSLLRFAVTSADGLGADSLLAEVREVNEAGRALFQKNGFKEVAEMKSASDAVLSRGGRILFKYEIRASKEVLVTP